MSKTLPNHYKRFFKYSNINIFHTPCISYEDTTFKPRPVAIILREDQYLCSRCDMKWSKGFVDLYCKLNPTVLDVI